MDNGLLELYGCQVIGIKMVYLFFIVCSFFAFFFISDLGSGCLFWFGFCALLLLFFSSDIEHTFFDFDAFAVFKFYFYFRIFHTLIFRFGKVCVQSIPSSFGTLWFVLDAPDASFTVFMGFPHVGCLDLPLTTSPSYFVLCFFVCLRGTMADSHTTGI